MIITSWCIFKKKHKASAFTGEGARLFGGRWTSKGDSAIYTSHSASLAVLEVLVHLQVHELLKAYLLASVTFEESLVETVSMTNLRGNWQKDPPPVALKKLGDQWVTEGKSAVLRVPSAIMPTEWNYLLNPAHSDFTRCVFGKPRPFKFEPRLGTKA